MKRLLFIIPLASLLLLSSCMQPTEAVVQTSVVTETQTQTVQAIPTTVVNTITIIKVVDPLTGNEYTIKDGEVGVANANASVNSYFNGLDAHWIGLVLNGTDEDQQLNISVTPYSNDSAAPAPNNIADWVTIINPNLVLNQPISTTTSTTTTLTPASGGGIMSLGGVLTVSPKSAASLYTTLNVPSGIQLPQEWGFTVNVWDANSGNYKAVNTVRWLVHMRSQS